MPTESPVTIKTKIVRVTLNEQQQLFQAVHHQAHPPSNALKPLENRKNAPKKTVAEYLANMADHENEHEHEIQVEETPIEKVEIDPSALTPTSPEVISRYRSQTEMKI